MENQYISNELWLQIAPHLPTYSISPKGGRPRLSLRKILEGIIYIKRNKLPWKAAPLKLGSKTALNDYYRRWAKQGVFHSLKAAGLLNKSELFCLNSDWEKLDKLANS